MLPENITAVVGRNDKWRGEAASEPYEAGWAREAVFFIRTLKTPVGEQPTVRVEISPDGMRWVSQGTQAPLPKEKDGLVALQAKHFGGWLRVATEFAPGAESTVLVTLHLKA